MIVLGLLLLGAGVLVIVGCVATAQATSVGIEVLGFAISPLTLFLLGLGSGLALMFGLGLIRAGTRRALKQRRERAKLAELSQKLDDVDAEKRQNPDDRELH